MRLALSTGTPVVPFAFIGGGEAVPTVVNLVQLGKLGVPYIPVALVVASAQTCRLQLLCGEPMVFEGTGREEDRYDSWLC